MSSREEAPFFAQDPCSAVISSNELLAVSHLPSHELLLSSLPSYFLLSLAGLLGPPSH